MKDGRIFQRRESIHRGCPDRPLTEGEVVSKFVGNARRVHSIERTGRILELVMNVDGIRDVAVLEATLAVEPWQGSSSLTWNIESGMLGAGNELAEHGLRRVRVDRDLPESSLAGWMRKRLR